MKEILECENLVKKYGDNVALDGIDLKLSAGRIVGLLGPNGSGKTTLIKIANKLLQPTSGNIKIFGMRPSVETKDLISYLPDCDFLPKWAKVSYLLDFYRDFYQDFDYQKASNMLEMLHINFQSSIKELSKGTVEKVQLALTMGRKAKIYILDEPIGGVDPATRDYILQTILSNYSENSLVIISTHLISDIESILDEAIFIKNGKIILHKPVDEIRSESGMSLDSYFREVFKC